MVRVSVINSVVTLSVFALYALGSYCITKCKSYYIHRAVLAQDTFTSDQNNIHTNLFLLDLIYPFELI